MQLFKQAYTFLLLQTIGLAAYSQFAKSEFVTRDARIDSLVNRHVAYSRELLKNKTRLEPGFRILVISTNDRDVALEARSKLIQFYPEQKSYMYYQSPYFKIQFGNFKTSKEAQEFKKMMKVIFGDTIVVIPAQIEVRADIELTPQ